MLKSHPDGNIPFILPAQAQKQMAIERTGHLLLNALCISPWHQHGGQIRLIFDCPFGLLSAQIDTTLPAADTHLSSTRPFVLMLKLD